MNKKKSIKTRLPATPEKSVKKIAPRIKKGGSAVKKMPDAFPVVGIGASAGGLEALEAFFRNMPPDPGMAFVVVQHLDPTYKGILTELIQRTTAMRAFQIKDGMALKPDHIYVIPPNADLSILNGTLRLQKPSITRGLRLPIDFFFRHLAEDQKEKGIGVILSGMGSDGTNGIKAIKEKMGMAMAQDPNSAKYDSMPRNAIESGMVDYIAPVEELPAKLIDYARHAVKGGLPKALPEDEKTRDALDQIFLIIRNRTGHDFSLYKKNSIIRRIERRMGIHQIDKFSDYQRYLRSSPQEIDLLFKELLIGVTSFFRDPVTFELLKKKYLPALIQRIPKGSTIRAWVPGCSTGEEAYSLAIILQECLEKVKLKGNYKVQIFATDIDNDTIEKARRGVLPAGIAAEVSPRRLAKFFKRQEDGYQINKEVRETVLFAVQNVIMDPPFTKLDLISCRNLLIYLEADLQKRLIPLFYQALNPSGILFLGSSETIGGFNELFSTLDRKWRVYEKKEGALLPNTVRDYAVPLFTSKMRVDDVATYSKELESSVPELMRSAILENFAPPAVLVNRRGDILYISGRTGKYLEPASGKANLNILAMAREDLRFEIGSAIHKAASQKTSVTVRDIRVKANGGEQHLNVAVRPLNPGKESELLMVVFEDIKTPEEAVKGGKGKGGANVLVERELQRTKERLNATVEEMQVSQEEYRAANEELESTNEELQSTNEELISSKEEMQSLNEELMSVNAELQEKVSALLEAENDMKNLLNSTEIATLFLDNALKVRRFTPEAAKIIKLIKGDVGRPITDIVSNLKYDRLGEDAEEVLEKLATKEMEVESKDGNWYMMRILPYRTVENVIQGVVITFTGITALKRLEMAVREERQYAESILETVREPLVVLDGRLRVVSANLSFYRTFHVNPAEIEKKLIFSLGNRQWDIPELRELLEKIIPEKNEFNNFRVEHTFPNIGKKTMLLNARRIEQKAGGRELILLAIEDVAQVS